MIQYILILLLSVFSINTFAESIKSQIYEIEIDLIHREGLVKFNNGEVAFVDTREKGLLKDLHEAQVSNAMLSVEIDNQRSIKSLLDIEINPFETFKTKHLEDSEFKPTILNTMPEVYSIFKKMRRDWQFSSQCYNRAHIWAYEAFEDFNLNSIKLFMFFTSSYIRNYRYKWWFHVSPMVLLKNGEDKTELVLDRRFSNKPLKRKTWSDLFIYSKRECPVIKSYSYYENNQDTEDCYHIPVSMYFWQPRDIKKFEQSGHEKFKFINSEINWAYDEAF